MKQLEITAPIQKFDLSGGSIKTALREYCNVNLNYGLIRQYFQADIYDVNTGSGEQRSAIKRRVFKLKKEFSNHRFTPDTIYACALPEHIQKNEDGTVTIRFTNTPIPILNGFQRIEALELLRQEGKDGTTQRLVDNLPWPVIISLNPENRKIDFLNLNNGLSVNRSHILQLSIDTNNIDNKYLKYYKIAKEILLELNKDQDSPYYDLVQFDQVSLTPPLNAAVLMNRHKTDQLTSFFGSARLLEITNSNIQWFTSLVKECITIINNNTKACDQGKLLSFPNTDRYKTGATLFIGIINQLIYYMFLKNIRKFDTKTKQIFINAVKIFDQQVYRDSSTKRRSDLMRKFAIIMFDEIIKNSNNKIVGWQGIPQVMIAFFSPGTFGIESPTKPVGVKIKTRKNKNLPVDVKSIQNIQVSPTTKIDSDTDPEFLED